MYPGPQPLSLVRNDWNMTNHLRSPSGMLPGTQSRKFIEGFHWSGGHGRLDRLELSWKGQGCIWAPLDGEGRERGWMETQQWTSRGAAKCHSQEYPVQQPLSKLPGVILKCIVQSPISRDFFFFFFFVLGLQLIPRNCIFHKCISLWMILMQRVKH